MIGFKPLARKALNLSLALSLAAAQLFAPISAFIPKAYAANEITASNHEGQLKPSGAYSNGNITTYAELDKVNYRFTLDSSALADGQMQVRFSGVETVGQACTFFQQSFSLGTHDSSAAAVVPVSGSTPVVTTVGTPAASGDEWVQTLDVDFAAAGAAVVNYYLTLSDEAGDCGGSSQHSRLNNVSGPSGGDFANIGAQNVPIPAKDIIELATITVTKYVDDDGDGQSDRTASAGEWNFTLEGGAPVATNSNGQVIFPNLQTDSYDISESGPSEYSFLSVSGTNCVPGNAPGTAVASVTAAPTAIDASCDFYNGIRPGHIIIEKQTLPNGDPQSFAFTADYDGDGFSLSDGQTNDSGSLIPGTYSVSETVPTGWDLTSAICDDGSPANAIVLGAGETVTCVFTNTKRGHLIVQKTTDPAADPTVFSINASSSTGGTITGSGAGTITDALDKDYEVTPGTYSVTETLPGGWSKDESDCQNVVVAPGATEYCTITNTKLSTIVIVKDALPNDSFDFSFLTATLPGGNFSLDDDSGAVGEDATLSNQATFANLTPNTAYTVSESSAAGWQLTGLTCDKGNYNIVGSQVTATPAPGETITCTFTNTKLRSISGIKYEADADGGLGSVLGGWTIQLYLEGNLVGQTTTDAVTGAYSFTDLLPGNYTLTEILQAGWTQIFSPDAVNLSYNADSTGNDFGNFENGSVSGYKWNDINGDGTRTEDEPKLSGWTIRLLRSSDNTEGNYVEVATTVTDVNGNYSFTNLSPLPSRFYAVCEVQQAGWVQTSPLNNACRYFEINLSGESNANRNFGNQGRGTITVIKDVDTDNDGDVDLSGVTDWTWDISGGAQNTATGSSQNVAAGTYTISEDQKTDYHVTNLTCDNQSYGAVESGDVTVGPGGSVTCTFTNARDTGTITVRKVINPTDDDGLFDLNINDITYGNDVSHGEGTGTIQFPTGTYNVSEAAGTGTDLGDYSSSFECDNDLSGDGTATGDFTLGTDEDVVCVFTNVRYGHIIVEKQTLPDGSSESFEFDTDYDFANFNLIDGQQNNSGNLLPGTYSVEELDEAGWDLTDVTCSDESNASEIELSAGETVTCVFTNTQHGQIIVTKYNDLDRDGEYDADDSDTPAGVADPTLSGWTFNLGEESPQTTGSDGTATFANLEANQSYDLSEVEQDGWTLSDIDCTGQEREISFDLLQFAQIDQLGTSVFIAPGETVNCYVGNYQAPVLLIAKANNRPDPTVVGDTVTYTLTVTVPQNSGTVFDVITQDLPPEGFNYVPGSWTASSSVRGNIKNGPTIEPTYGSPGTWILGTMIPGEVVTLTYQTLIANTASAGTYPDIAFANGCELPFTEGDCEVLSNVSAGANSPFVATNVTIKAPQVLGASTTVLVNTGAADIWRNLMVGTMLMGVGLATLVRRQKKGAQL